MRELHAFHCTHQGHACIEGNTSPEGRKVWKVTQRAARRRGVRSLCPRRFVFFLFSMGSRENGTRWKRDGTERMARWCVPVGCPRVG